MPDDIVRKMAEEALNRLSAALEACHSEALKQYLASMGRFHRYSWGNVLLIHSQRPDASRIAGFHTWHDLGRWVKKGEKGITIFAPMLMKQKETAAAGQETSKPDQVFRLVGFRAAYIFRCLADRRPAFAGIRKDHRRHQRIRRKAQSAGRQARHHGRI